jgi:hypothetical protein
MSGIKIVCKAPHHAGKVTIVRRFHYFAELGWAIEEIERSRPRYALAGQALDSDSRPISGRRREMGLQWTAFATAWNATSAQRS